MRLLSSLLLLFLIPLSVLSQNLVLSKDSGYTKAQTIIWTEDFEGSLSQYSSTYDPSYSECGWGDVSCTSNGGNWSVWCGDNGADCYSSNCSEFPTDMYASFSMDNFLDLQNYDNLTFSYYIWYETGSGDEVQLWYDIGDGNGWTQSTISYSGSSNGWQYQSIDLSSSFGNLDDFKWDFRFVSNSWHNGDQGAYLDDMMVTGNDPSSVKALNSNSDVSLYPNPSQGKINLQVPRDIKFSQDIKVYSRSGKLVHSQEMDSKRGNSNKQLDLSHLERGLYILEIILEDQVIKKKVMIQ